MIARIVASPSPLRARLITAARWLAPSLVASCVGVIVAAVVDAQLAHGGGWPALAVPHDLHRRITAIGVVATAYLPRLVVAAVVARTILAAWQPRALVRELAEPDGRTPRLAGWIAAIWLGALGLTWAMFQGTWLLASWTAFKPLTLGFLMPMLGVAAVLAIVALAPPAARLLAIVARGADRGWRATIGRVPRMPRTALTPGILLAGTAVATALAGALIWYLVVSPRLGGLALGWLWAPAAGLAATAAAHAAWRGPIVARAIAGALIAAATIAAIAVARDAAANRPELALSIWAEAPLARRALERDFELEAIRGALVIDAFRPRARAALHRDLVVVTFDALAADATPPYGGAAAMPALAQLAARGVVFERAIAASDRASRAMPALLTGVSAARVRGRDGGWVARLDPRHVLVAERLRAAGYQTAVFACCREAWSPGARTGWTRGFDHVVVDLDPAALARAAHAWLARTAADPRPRLLWVHLAAARDRAALARADAALLDVLAAFASRPPDRAPITIVTAAAGAPADPRAPLAQPTLHVPLVIAGPGVVRRRIVETVAHVDVAPTVLELAGFDPSRIDGRSLAPLATGTRTSQRSTGLAYAVGGDDARAILRGAWKLIEVDGTYELYDLRADPGERDNRFGAQPAVSHELQLLLGSQARLARRPPF